MDFHVHVLDSTKINNNKCKTICNINYIIQKIKSI